MRTEQMSENIFTYMMLPVFDDQNVIYYDNDITDITDHCLN